MDAAFDHTHGVGVRPESPLWIKSIKELPVHSNILTLEIVDADRIQQDFEFDDILPEFWRESNVDDASLILIDILKCDTPLFKEVAALVGDLLIQLSKILW